MRFGSWCVWPLRLSLFVSISILPTVAQNLPLIASQPPALAGDSSPDNVPGARIAPRAAAIDHAPRSFNEVLDRIAEREHVLLAQMRTSRPMIETYLQNLKPNASGNGIPVNDDYFLGRLEMTDTPNDIAFKEQPRPGKSRLRWLSALYSPRFRALGFAQMTVPDTDFDIKNYRFNYVHREFLGAVRCLVIDVKPKSDAPPGRFEGRIWVEDQDYNIVRFNGTYVRPKWNDFYLHFDSWRLNLKPGMWLPAFIYSEEANVGGAPVHTWIKAQTRLWGYDLNAVGSNHNEEFAQIVVDPKTIRDQSDATADPPPVLAERMWERQGEDNVVERLQEVGLLAPPGEVDKVLQTVITNLLVTNNIDLQSEVRCRVLITAPLESFTLGHTIVLSRGLLDVLPDESSLAMVLAHELSHMVLGHYFDTKVAFNDRMFFPDQQTFRRLDFKRRPTDEAAADAKALELMKNSPYKDKLGTAGLFLRALQQRAPDLPNLIRPHLGDSLAAGQSVRMSALLADSSQLDQERIDQIAALPLGGRIRLDPWTDQVSLAKPRPVTLASAREKMPFEITPFFPYLTRLTNDDMGKEELVGSSLK